MREELQQTAEAEISFAIAYLEGKAQFDYIMHTVKSAYYSGKQQIANDIIELGNSKQIEIHEMSKISLTH